MEAAGFNAQLLHELDTGIRLGLGVLHGARLRTEGFVRGAFAEHILAAGAEVVPSGHGEGQVLLHFFTHDDPLGIAVFERTGKPALRPLTGDLGYAVKMAAYF